MSGGRINVLSGNAFVVSDGRGDIEVSPGDPSGLFAFDTRYLSTWVLTINGERLSALSVDNLRYFETRFFLVPGEATVYVDSQLSVIRQRLVYGGMLEELRVLNHSVDPIDLTVRMEAGCDFADIFEIKNVARAKKGSYYTRVEQGRLLYGYQRETFRRETEISANTAAQIDERGLTFRLCLQPQRDWATELSVVPLGLPGGHRDPTGFPKGDAKRARKRMLDGLEECLNEAPKLDCNWEPLEATYRRSLIDLAALRFAPVGYGNTVMPAAGLPWFMSLFGRDSIFTSLQALPFDPNLAGVTLRHLGIRQGGARDDFREEEPGRILHEARYGETGAFQEWPHTPYYGTADATQLYVVLLDEYERWTGDTELVRQFEFEARAALDWIDRYGDLMGNGYVSYQRRNEQTGLENQCWKDSWDSISDHNGRLPGFPRATCELQGYAYDAKVRGARLARQVWGDPALADRLEAEARDLKERFNRDFWVEDGEYFALALDGDGRQVDALSSNIGHLLWSGIVEESKAAPLVRHLMGPRLFSGWGVRTLAVGEGRYNPIGYHVGTVWPFDNSFIAWGLRRYGYGEEAARIAAGILNAADFFEGRLPEAFGGYDRSLTNYPVEYPTACSPQAWSAGAPLLLLRTMLGLEPQEDHLAANPALPAGIEHLDLLDVPGRWGRRDAFGRKRAKGRAQMRLTSQLGGEPAA